MAALGVVAYNSSCGAAAEKSGDGTPLVPRRTAGTTGLTPCILDNGVAHDVPGLRNGVDSTMGDDVDVVYGVPMVLMPFVDHFGVALLLVLLLVVRIRLVEFVCE
jgi:hypothetical protein